MLRARANCTGEQGLAMLKENRRTKDAIAATAAVVGGVIALLSKNGLSLHVKVSRIRPDGTAPVMGWYEIGNN